MEVARAVEEKEKMVVATKVQATGAVNLVGVEVGEVSGAVGAAATGTAAAVKVKVANWAADRTTVAPLPGTCSGRFEGGGGLDAARVQATMLPRKVQGWTKETRRRSLALCERRLTKKLLES